MRRAIGQSGAALLFVVIGIALGRASVSDGILSSAAKDAAFVARFDGGTVAAESLRDALPHTSDPKERRAVVEQFVRVHLLALKGEAAGLHRDPEFLNRYVEELARVYVETAFEEPFKKKIPTDEEVRKFFDENESKLGRPQRIRIAHIALLAPVAAAPGRAEKRRAAGKVLADLRRKAKDEYAFGQVAMTRSEDPRSRPAAGELPFLTRDEISARIGAEAAEAAFATLPGQMAARVIETEQGFQIVKVLAAEEARAASYDELRDSIKSRLTEDRREKAFKEFMDTIWKDADVEIDEKALEKLASEKTEKTEKTSK